MEVWYEGFFNRLSQWFYTLVAYYTAGSISWFSCTQWLAQEVEKNSLTLRYCCSGLHLSWATYSPELNPCDSRGDTSRVKYAVSSSKYNALKKNNRFVYVPSNINSVYLYRWLYYCLSDTGFYWRASRKVPSRVTPPVGGRKYTNVWRTTSSRVPWELDGTWPV